LTVRLMSPALMGYADGQNAYSNRHDFHDLNGDGRLDRVNGEHSGLRAEEQARLMRDVLQVETRVQPARNDRERAALLASLDTLTQSGQAVHVRLSWDAGGTGVLALVQ